MKLLVFIAISCFAFFASAKQLPSWVHELNAAGFDKPAHAVIFAILTYLCLSEFPKTPPLSIVAVLVVLGLCKEVAQDIFTSRTFCINDFISDVLGILSVYFFTQLFNISIFMKRIITFLFAALFAAFFAVTVSAQCPNPPCTLPISLSYFKAELKGETVKLTWATEAEKDASHFVIERGQFTNEFVKIAEINCNNKPSTYTLTDDTPLSTGAYYRLKQVDFDGKSEIFKAVYVESKSSNVQLFGNVVSDNLHLTGIADVYVSDTFGRVVRIAKGVNSLNVTDLSAGIYFARIVRNGKTSVQRFVKVR